MILAAGRGERLRPLTDRTPKPLLEAGGRPIIEYTIRALQKVGFNDLVINVAHLGDQIISCLGDGRRFHVSIQYSQEGSVGLETGGGIFRALPILGTSPFLVVNGDIFTEYPFQILARPPDGLAHLVLVSNPSHHRSGDFSLNADGTIDNDQNQAYTFSGLGIYRPELFAGCSDGSFPLAPLLRQAATKNQVTGEFYEGYWMDIGTPRRLRILDQKLSQQRLSMQK